MLFALQLVALALALAIALSLIILVSHRLTLSGHTDESAEKGLTPLAQAIAFEDGEIPVLTRRERATLATLLSRFSARLQGGSRERISEYFASHGHIKEEVDDLSDRRPWRRANAASSLGAMGSATAAPNLIAALEDQERDVRAAAARSLGQLQAPEAVDALVAALVTRRVPRGIIGQALLAVGPGAIERLLPVLRDPEPEVRATAAELIGLLGDAGEAEQVAARLGDSSAAVRAQAARALGRLGSAAAVDGLEAALSDRAHRVQTAAAEALGAISNPHAFQALHGLSGCDSFELARASAQALARIDPARLREAAREPTAGPHVREAATTADAVER